MTTGHTRLPRQRLRSLLHGDRCVLMASVFDPISARLAEHIGYEAALAGGSVVSHAVLAAPDIVVLTLSELAEQIRRCTRVSSVPLVVDGDHGYGNALNAMRTIDELERAGAAAVSIEDTALPRAYGPSDPPALLSIDASAAKMRAAVEARGDSELLVFGRTGAITATGVDDAIARLLAYEAAGVDALFLPGLKSIAVLERIAAATTLPIVAAGLDPSLGDRTGLARHRVRLASTGHATFAVAVRALHDAMRSFHDGVPSAQLAGAASNELMRVATGADAYDERTARFLGGG